MVTIENQSGIPFLLLTNAEASSHQHKLTKKNVTKDVSLADPFLSFCIY